MKKVILFSLYAILFVQINYAQPILEENFDYAPGILTSVSSSWVITSFYVNHPQVVEGNLSYPGYPSSSIGNMLFCDAMTSTLCGAERNFTPILGEGKNVFVSLLLNVVDTLDFSATNSALKLKTMDGLYKIYLILQKASAAGQYRIGISKAASNYTFLQQLFNTSTTYLVVFSYQFRPGSDSLKLWINPDITGSIPIPDLAVCPSGSDASSLGAIAFSPGANSGNILFDGIRIDSAWAQAPLPVELTSFTGKIVDDQIILEWTTETEVDNYGFDIEKRSVNSDWITIGFKEGHGNCNTPKYYSFIDFNTHNLQQIFYRLKQIDNDGSYSYSKEVIVSAAVPEDFFLFQNYPNPFNPVTSIRYKVPSSGTKNEGLVSIKLYDVLGNEVAVVVNEYKPAGTYEIKLDASSLGLSGSTYFYRMNITYAAPVKGYSAVKKLILLK